MSHTLVHMNGACATHAGFRRLGGLDGTAACVLACWAFTVTTQEHTNDQIFFIGPTGNLYLSIGDVCAEYHLNIKDPHLVTDRGILKIILSKTVCLFCVSMTFLSPRF